MSDAVRELVIKVSVDADTDDLKKVGAEQKKTEASTVALGTALGALAAKLVEVGVAAVASAAKGMAALVFETAEAGDEIAKTADKLGVASDQLQRLRGAAQLSGAEVTDINSAIADLSKNLSEGIEKGAGPAVEALATLGLEVADLDASLAEGDIEATLGLIGDAMNNTADQSRATAAAAKLLGGSGKELGPLLRAGTDGIKELGDEISATGSVIDSEGLAKFEKMQDASLLTSKRIEGMKNTIAVGLAPAVEEIGGRVSGWIDENQAFIEQDLPGILSGVANAAIALAEFTLETASSFREFGRDVGRVVEVLEIGLEPQLDAAEGAFSSIGAAISGASLATLDLVDSFLEAIGAGEELRQLFKEIRNDIAGDDAPKGTRGAPGFAGGGTALVNPSDAKAAESSGDTSKLKKISADPRFSDADRAKAASQAEAIDQREAAKAAAEGDKKARERASNVEASRARTRAAQRGQARARARAAPRTGGGGGGAAQPTVEDLIAAAPSGASPSALRSASSALSGTLLVTQITNNNMNSTVSVGGVQVSAALGADLGSEVANAVVAGVSDKLDRQNREAQDWLIARQNVGFA